MTHNRSTPLFGGEVVITPHGIYTFAHYYLHPEMGRRVAIIGMAHTADREFFEKVKEILGHCDIVLFEELRTKNNDVNDYAESEIAKDIKRLRGVVFDEDAERLFSAATELYLMIIDGIILGAEEDERSAFNIEYRHPHWFPADARPYTESQKRRYWALRRKFESTAHPGRKRILSYIRENTCKLEQGQFTKQDFVESNAFIYSDSDAFMAEYLQKSVRQRDINCFKEFDRLVRTKNPQVIGIKFGAAHIAFQRQLLERRGYVYCKSEKIRCISLE